MKYVFFAVLMVVSGLTLASEDKSIAWEWKDPFKGKLLDGHGVIGMTFYKENVSRRQYKWMVKTIESRYPVTEELQLYHDVYSRIRSMIPLPAKMKTDLIDGGAKYSLNDVSRIIKPIVWSIYITYLECDEPLAQYQSCYIEVEVEFSADHGYHRVALKSRLGLLANIDLPVSLIDFKIPPKNLEPKLAEGLLPHAGTPHDFKMVGYFDFKYSIKADMYDEVHTKLDVAVFKSLKQKLPHITETVKVVTNQKGEEKSRTVVNDEIGYFYNYTITDDYMNLDQRIVKVRANVLEPYPLKRK